MSEQNKIEAKLTAITVLAIYNGRNVYKTSPGLLLFFFMITNQLLRSKYLISFKCYAILNASTCWHRIILKVAITGITNCSAQHTFYIYK